MFSVFIRCLILPAVVLALTANLHAACGGGGGGGGYGGGPRVAGGGGCGADLSNPMGQAFRVAITAGGGSASDGAKTEPIKDRIGFSSKTMTFPTMGGKVAYTWSKAESCTTIKAETGDEKSGRMVFVGSLASGKLTGTLTASKEGRETRTFTVAN